MLFCRLACLSAYFAFAGFAVARTSAPNFALEQSLIFHINLKPFKLCNCFDITLFWHFRKSVSKLSRGSSPLEHLPFVSGNRTSSLNIFSNTQPKDSDAKLMTRGATLSRKRSLGESLRNLSPTANLRGTQPRVNVGDDRIGNELLMTTMKDSSTNKSVSGNDTSEAQWYCYKNHF